jgi:hypothetical protein
VLETGHDEQMAKLKRLQDVYRFPGFTPEATVRGIFGDPKAVVITLRRRGKKRAVVSVARGIAPSTTNGLDSSGISRAATAESISRSRYDAFAVSGAVA